MTIFKVQSNKDPGSFVSTVKFKISKSAEAIHSIDSKSMYSSNQLSVPKQFG